MRSKSGDFLFSLFRFLVGVDAVGGDFDLGNAAEGEQKLYEVLGRLFRSLFHNVGNRVGDRHAADKDATESKERARYIVPLRQRYLSKAGEVRAHESARLQHDSKIVPLPTVKCKAFAMILDLGV